MTATLAASPLAAPPPPAIPVLERPLGPDELADALRAFSTSYYASHPFHQLMHEGRLTPRTAPGLGGQPAGLPASHPPEGCRDHLKLSRSRRSGESGSSESSITTA